ncbi:MAG TPA: HgcAB-like fusion protein [Thermoanaerobaculia bacterium]|nr:HgcAB-like fusion protein [Thermoanaerobaculia bacterium]
MKKIKAIFWELFHIFFRHYNFPCKLGLIRVGNPDRDSPVFLSGNYTLTVQRVLRKLQGIDCYLLVANSRGSNVWCAVGMNEFSEYDIIDAINVTGLKDLVNHRRMIAPVYAAPGVDVKAVKRETGFNVHWGPTHLDDLPRYIANGFRRTNDMFQVKFGFQDRLEQALSTSLAYSLTLGVGLFFFPGFFLRTIGIIFLVYMFGFCFYPIFPRERLWGRTLLIAAILSAAMAAFGAWQGWASRDFLLWQGVLLGVVLLMAMDACGSSPLYKTTIKHWLTKGDYKSLFNPVIDPALCINCMQCVIVCPKDVFAARRQGVKTVVAVKPDECEECLACVKQCPTDAIFNRSGEYKGDVKSIPNLHHIVTRDWSHLRDEDRWIGKPVVIRGGFPVVAEEVLNLEGTGTTAGGGVLEGV